MAFDQTTRNRLQKFVSESRKILTDEFTRQLQAVYGLDPINGSVADIETLHIALMRIIKNNNVNENIEM